MVSFTKHKQNKDSPKHGAIGENTQAFYLSAPNTQRMNQNHESTQDADDVSDGLVDAARSIERWLDELDIDDGVINERLIPTRPLTPGPLWNLAKEDDDRWRSTSVPLKHPLVAEEQPFKCPPPSPKPSLEKDENPESSFRHKLASMLLWYKESLDSEQQLTVLCSLVEGVPTWQKKLLISFINETGKATRGVSNKNDNTVGQIHSPLPTRPFQIYKNTRIGKSQHRFEISTTPATSSSPTPNFPDFDLKADLFYSDIHAWLRYHRLHKYSKLLDCFGDSKQELLQIKEKDLELAGVNALGARRKFLKLFQLLKDDKDSTNHF